MTKQKKRHGERRVWFPRILFFKQNSQKKANQKQSILKKRDVGEKVFSFFFNLAFRVYC